MTFLQYLEKVKEILKQQEEGAIYDYEAYHAIIFYAHGVTEEISKKDEMFSESLGDA